MSMRRFIYLLVLSKKLDAEQYSYFRAGGMSSQLVRPNLTLQLNAWVADNFMNIEIPFSTLYYNVITLKR